MCGFFASSKKLNISEIKLISERLFLRGPDDIKIRANQVGSFIFTRLACTGRHFSSMQPLSHQEFGSKNFMFFNGEIYNYKNLCSKIKINKKKNLSDTEVLDGLIKKFGFKSSVNKLNGAYAIGYVKNQFEYCFLTRDIYGQRPLYYAFDKKHWYFSSDPYSVAFCSDNTISISVLKKFLLSNEDFGTRGLIVPNSSFFKNVNSVDPGSIIFLNKYGFRYIKKNFIIPENTNYFQQNKSKNLSQVTKKFNSTIDKIVKSYVDNFKDVCFEFSGGIDSTLLLLSSLKLKQKFTYYVKIAKGIDHIAKKSVNKLKKLKRKFKIIHVKKENYILETIKFIRYSASPPRWGTAPSMLPLYEEMKKNNMKICLSGTGADELFYGYNNIKKILETNFHELKKKQDIDIVKEFSFSGWNGKINENSKYIIKINELIEFYKTKNPNYKGNIYSICNFIRFIDLNIFLTEISSPHADLMSMMHSIELRLVFLDFDVVKLALKEIDHKLLLHEKSQIDTKSFLKKALEYRCKDLKLNPRYFVEKKKEGTRNFAMQAFRDLSLKNIPKKILKELDIEPNKKISDKMKYKMFFIIFFYMIFKLNLTDHNILEITTKKNA